VNLWVAEWAKSFLDLVAMVKGWTFLPLSAVMQTSTEEFFYLLFLFHVVPNCILCNYVLCMHLCGVLSLGEDYPGSISSVKKVFPMGLWLRHRMDMASTFFFLGGNFGRKWKFMIPLLYRLCSCFLRLAREKNFLYGMVVW